MHESRSLALVTGSTAGIGLAIATGLVEAGAHVWVSQPVIEPNGEGTPFATITKDNLPPPGGEFSAKVDYRSKFLSLWK